MTEENAREDANKYELMVIINPEIGMEAVNKRLEEIRKVLSAKKGGVQGEIFFEEIWGMRDLAYRIKKHDKGYYAVFDFLTDPSLIKEMENTLRLEPEVIRHMIVRLPGNYETKNYTALFAEQAALEEAKKAERLAKRKPAPAKTVTRVSRPVVAKPAEKAEKAEESTVKASEVKDAKVTENAPEEKPKKKETTLEDVDAKLKSIIDNPDINF